MTLSSIGGFAVLTDLVASTGFPAILLLAIIGILGHLPLIGWIAGIIGGLLGLYFTVSIVLAVLDFLKVLK